MGGAAPQMDWATDGTLESLPVLDCAVPTTVMEFVRTLSPVHL